MSSRISKADALKRAIKLQKAIPDRADNQKIEEHARLFVDNPQQDIVTTMGGNANQILYGRRGTGKTMLFRQLQQRGRPYNSEGNYVVLMIPVPNFHRSPDVTEKDPPISRARCYFREFLQQIAEKLIDIGDDILRDESLLARLGIRNRVRRELLAEKFLVLSTTLKYGTRLFRPDTAKLQESLKEIECEERKKDQTGSIGLSGKANFPNETISASGEIDSHTSLRKRSDRYHQKTDIFIEDFIAQYDFGVPEIRANLKDIIEMIQISHVVILIDEWVELSLDIQAEFAHLLKRCFFGIDCVSVKIAAYRNICQFNNGGGRANFRGLEIGQDIAITGDTDLSPSEANTTKFLFDVLYRRLLLKGPELERYYGPPDRFDYKDLIKDIFRNRNAAGMLVRGCHGISRDFIKAFNVVTGLLDDDVARVKISLNDVNRAHGKISRDDVQSNIHTADDVGGLLFEIIKPHVHRTGAPFFFLPQTDHQWDSLLWELVEKRAIHVVPSNVLPDGADVDWVGFEVAYGLFQEWRRAQNFVGEVASVRMEWSDVSHLDPEEFARHVLRIEDTPSSIRICNICGKPLSTKSHSFIVARRCPHCYEQQTN